MAEKDGKAQDVNGAQFGGRTAMCVYTLLAAGENDQDPKLVKAIEFLKTAKITGTYALGLRCQAMLFLPNSPEVKAVALGRFAFDRECESAADGYAVKLLKDAGLDPATLLAYLKTLPAPQGQEYAVYPAPAERIEAAQRAIAGLRK